MKKLFCIITAIFMLFAISLTACSNEEGQIEQNKSGAKEITVFSWEDYIDEGYDEEEIPDLSDALTERIPAGDLTERVVDIFERETGIKVNYYSFANNEEMYNELIKNPKACDLLCPSEYMILKLRDEGRIKPYNIPQNYIDYGSPYIKHMFENIGLNHPTEPNKTYAIGYMWGTMGVIYDADKYSAEDFDLWSNLFGENFKNRLTIKDSLRDSYIMALAIVFEDELLEQKQLLEDGAISDSEYESNLAEIFNRTDKETVKKVENVLKDLKKHLYGFEVDAGKNDILSGKIDVNFAWSGDAVYSMFQGDDLGVNLGYAVPQTGSNVWFDGWVMTKDANEEYATQFLNFISRPDIVIRNMEYIGYTSCVGGDEVFNYVKDTYNEEEGSNSVSLKYFFDWENQNSNEYAIKLTDESMGRQLYAQYADRETILRCAVMQNFSDDDLELISDMWNKVKLITLSNVQIFVILGVIVFLILVAIFIKFKDKIFEKTISSQQTKPRRKGCKVIKIEKV